jgi:cytidine deaminase
MAPLDRDTLIAQALAAAERAYAPYSGYAVGAALLADDGTIVTGCNVENTSYGLTVCAERVALTRAVAEGHRAFRGLAIAARGTEMPFPCGACRQVLAEFCDSDMPVYMVREQGELPACRALGELLPEAFRMRPGS